MSRAAEARSAALFQNQTDLNWGRRWIFTVNLSDSDVSAFVLELIDSKLADQENELRALDRLLALWIYPNDEDDNLLASAQTSRELSSLLSSRVGLRAHPAAWAALLLNLEPERDYPVKTELLARVAEFINSRLNAKNGGSAFNAYHRETDPPSIAFNYGPVSGRAWLRENFRERSSDGFRPIRTVDIESAVFQYGRRQAHRDFAKEFVVQ